MPCPYVAAELPHHTPSTTNNFGSVYDVTYIVPDPEPGRAFCRPKTSGYARNARPFQSEPTIDYSRAVHGVGRGAGTISAAQRATTAQSRTSIGPHSGGSAPTGLSEMHDRYRDSRPATASGRQAMYAGAHTGGGAASCLDWGNPDWARPRMPVPPLARCASARGPHAGNAWAPHLSDCPLDSDTTNATYGRTARDATARDGALLPPLGTGENARDRLFSVSVQKCADPSRGVRSYPADEFNPNVLTNAQADRCRISRRVEHEGWVKHASVTATSTATQHLYPETDGLNRCRGMNAPAVCAARGGNSNREMFGDVQAHVIIDESRHAGAGADGRTHGTIERLQHALEVRYSTVDRHAHRRGVSELSAKFRPAVV